MGVGLGWCAALGLLFFLGYRLAQYKGSAGLVLNLPTEAISQLYLDPASAIAATSMRRTIYYLSFSGFQKSGPSLFTRSRYSNVLNIRSLAENSATRTEIYQPDAETAQIRPDHDIG
jgi:LPS-assembly protein